MSNKITRVKGMYDVLPQSSVLWQRLEDAARANFVSYGYGEIRLPVLEKTALFAGAMGETTDVVSKEMYTFEDRSGVHLSLRPEGTAGCVRAMIQNGLLQGQAHRVWYQGAMFRRENVQRGRSRQFHQIGGEAFGLPGPDIDAEMIILLQRLWQRLGLAGLRLELNTLGTPQSRQAYRAVLVEYFQDHADELDDDSQIRLHKNPLRILDSKNPAMQELIAAAPLMSEHLDMESSDHFGQLRDILDAAGVNYELNSRLVRGLDYYTKTVFEWITEDLGAQGTVCAGGRYDGLVASQGGRDTPAVGFAMGLERLVALMEQIPSAADDARADIYAVVPSAAAMPQAMVICENVRDVLPQVRLEINCGGGSFKAQFKRADRSGAQLALIFGEKELEAGEISIKPLRDSQAEQQSVAVADLPSAVAGLLNL